MNPAPFPQVPDVPQDPLDPLDLVREHTIYACVMGSRAFGLATDGSDTDRRGVFLAPTPLFWRFEKPPTHVEGPADEQFGWELERFCELALRANPNVLECLHSPLVEHVTDTGRELLALRPAFLSRQAHETFALPQALNFVRAGETPSALGQRKKLDADVRTHGAPRWKHAMHLLRLLMSCRDLLLTGELTIDVGDRREPLLAVKRGEVGWPEVEAWMARLAAEADAAAASTSLPLEPDRRRVEDFLYRARRASALEAGPYDEVVQRVVRDGGVRQG
ncbi:nucleotidyltransferase domain-containing protein [Streptomyces flavofungini]|uniref:nucleotidyltransferase domain-containing protein n=1 Tax=Streptomyces flavofungini TaxID=68200 RepID=UPI0025B0DB6A|nr:nucleotidyltransferase domain-containing protein [Streptomyces flavofungini]WJV49683.1 nucleotidyltransferase domain-containing protein [Streptomyces flavofungini]